MVQVIAPSIGGHYGTSITRQRPHDGGGPSSDTTSQASIRTLAERYSINPKTVAKWKKRQFASGAPMGPREPCSTVLSKEEEAIVVTFRRHTLLPLDDSLYARQATLPRLTRSSLHRCFQRHGISRLPEVEGDKPRRKVFKVYPIGFFHIDCQSALNRAPDRRPKGTPEE